MRQQNTTAATQVQSMHMHNGKLVVTNNKGTFLIEPPVDKFRSVSQVNNHLYCDGYEYDFENQKWIAKSWWKKIFG